MHINERPAWVADAVFYQIFPDRFARSEGVAKPSNLEPWNTPPTAHGYKGGDLMGVVDHLDYLSDLGVNAIYFNPVFQSASNHGYHTHDYYRIDPLLGGDQAFETMLTACHSRGIRVVLDGVFNHASRGFFQFNDVLENGNGSPWREWFIVEDGTPNAYDHDEAPGYHAWWGLHALPKLNTDNPQVREFIMGVAEHWIGRGADGWRLDVPAEISTEGFWEEFRVRVRAVNQDAYIVGEVWDPAPEWINDGSRFDAVMNYPFTEAIARFVAGVRIDEELAKRVHMTLAPPVDASGYGDLVTEHLDRYPADAHRSNLNLLGSHDTPRVRRLFGEDPAAVHLAYALLFTFPGAPCVYYGDEIGLSGGQDPDNRATFPWDQSETWDEATLGVVRSLIRLRHDHAALRHGTYEQEVADGDLYVFSRHLDGSRLVVGVNAADHGDGTMIEGTSADLLWGDGAADPNGAGVRINLPARSGGVWSVT